MDALFILSKVQFGIEALLRDWSHFACVFVAAV